MIVSCFADHLAYSFESEDQMFMLGMKMLKKNDDNLLSAVDVVYNDRIRLLYGIEGYKPLSEAVKLVNDSELAIALVNFIKSIQKIETSDFLKINAIDINFNRLYYDMKNQTIKYVLLPINYECNFNNEESWSVLFRQSILIVLSEVFKNYPEKYQETYYAILDESKNDYEILDYVEGYDFGLQNVAAGEKESEDVKADLKLVHNGIYGNLVFNINKPEYTIGKSSTVDGCISGASNVSRKHCLIAKTNGSFVVEDLRSTNGTCLNGYRLNPNEMYYLNDGDILSFADVDFTVVLG